MGRRPHAMMQHERDQKTGFPYTPRSSRPKSRRINRLLVAFTLLTKRDSSRLGGSSTRTCPWLGSPLNSMSSLPQSSQRCAMISRRRHPGLVPEYAQHQSGKKLGAS